MQDYEQLQGILNNFKNLKKDSMYFQKLKVFINSKVKILLKKRS